MKKDGVSSKDLDGKKFVGVVVCKVDLVSRTSRVYDGIFNE
jgi:hypothetical protein